MTETAVAKVPVPASERSQKAVSKKVAAPKRTAAPSKTKSHPPTGEMVVAAITALKDKKGSSLQAIKKYIASNYKVDLKKQSIFINKYLKSAVEKNILVQAKGTGASGRFKLPLKEGGKAKVVKKPATKKPTAGKTAVKKPATKKVTSEKKVAAKKTATKTSTSKSPSKAKKTGKAPAAPKTPKPKVIAPKAKPVKK